MECKEDGTFLSSAMKPFFIGGMEENESLSKEELS